MSKSENKVIHLLFIEHNFYKIEHEQHETPSNVIAEIFIFNPTAPSQIRNKFKPRIVPNNSRVYNGPFFDNTSASMTFGRVDDNVVMSEETKQSVKVKLIGRQ